MMAPFFLDKEQADSLLAQKDRSKWYHIDFKQVSLELTKFFFQLTLDQETKDFLDNCLQNSAFLFTQLWHSMLMIILRWFLTKTDINGFLGRGSMFVFSKAQFRQLLDRCVAEEGELLDLGAGDGMVTQIMANFFSKVYVTEVSFPMRWRLKRRGFQVLEVDGWGERKYDVISCLNLLDRCDRPCQIMQNIRRALKPNGKAVFALVLPYVPFVEYKRGNRPEEELLVKGVTLEQQIESVIRNVFGPAGFTVIRWSRLPYLSEGDLQQAYYWLDDVVFVTKFTSAHDELLFQNIEKDKVL